jgi:hypothetical protein
MYDYNFCEDTLIFTRTARRTNCVPVPETPVSISTVIGESTAYPNNPIATWADGATNPILQINIVDYVERKTKQAEKAPGGRTVWRGTRTFADKSTEAISVAFRKDWDPLIAILHEDGSYACSTRADAFASDDEAAKMMIQLAEDWASGTIPELSLKTEKLSRLRMANVPTTLPSQRTLKLRGAAAAADAAKKVEDTTGGTTGGTAADRAAGRAVGRGGRGGKRQPRGQRNRVGLPPEALAFFWRRPPLR